MSLGGDMGLPEDMNLPGDIGLPGDISLPGAISLPGRAIAAVLTGDIVNSTKLLLTQEARLMKALGQLLGGFRGKRRLHEFYRGDSFQVYLDDPAEALRLALVCRALAIEVTGDEETEVVSDIRISIGIGEVKLPIHQLGIAKGDAFILSGRRFDQLQQSEQRLAIGCGVPLADLGFQVMADYLDSIFKGMTAKQARVIQELLQGTTQQRLAATLNKSKSTISQLANTGRWGEIEKLLLQYETLIKHLS
jgi:hypothetical protein